MTDSSSKSQSWTERGTIVGILSILVLILLSTSCTEVEEIIKDINRPDVEKPEIPIKFSWADPSWWHGEPGGHIVLENTSDKELVVTVSISDSKDVKKFRARLPAHTSKKYYGSEFNWAFQLGETVSVEHPDYKIKGWNLTK
jgi:hypothetical protein